MIYVDLLSIPFKKGGRDAAGMDCWGLCLEVARRAGIDLPDYLSPDNPEEVGSLADAERACYVRLNRPEPFCLVAFAGQGKYVDHLGMVLEDGRSFIHCSSTRGRVTIESLNHPVWSKILAGFYKHQKQ